MTQRAKKFLVLPIVLFLCVTFLCQTIPEDNSEENNSNTQKHPLTLPSKPLKTLSKSNDIIKPIIPPMSSSTRKPSPETTSRPTDLLNIANFPIPPKATIDELLKQIKKDYQIHPEDISLAKRLFFIYMLKKDYANALELIHILQNEKDALLTLMISYLYNNFGEDEKAMENIQKVFRNMKKLNPLKITKALFVYEVRGFDLYTPLKKSVFKPASHILLYCELQNFYCKERQVTRDKEEFVDIKPYEIDLYGDCEIIDEKGNIVKWENKEGFNHEYKRLCGTYINDLYLAIEFNLPHNILPGKYELKLTIKDKLADNKSASIKVPFIVR